MRSSKPARPLEPHSRGVPGNERISGFSDGIFTITITLMVLELHVPDPTKVSTEQLPAALVTLLPQIAAHLISFAVLGVYWVGQHNMFLHIRRHDRVMLWLNILFLMCISSMPFLLNLVVAYGNSQLAVVIYAGVLVLAGLALDTIWRYASTGHRLIDPHIEPEFIAFVHRVVLRAPLIYLLAIAVSFFSLAVAKLLFIPAILFYILPGIDRYHHHQLHAREQQPAEARE